MKSALSYKQSEDYENNKQLINDYNNLQNSNKEQRGIKNNFEASYDGKSDSN